MQEFAIVGPSVAIAATASSVPGAFVMTSPANAIYICNTSATLYSTVNLAVSGAVAVLGTGLTIPPFGQVLISASPNIGSVAAIGSAIGPTAVVFTPVHTL